MDLRGAKHRLRIGHEPLGPHGRGPWHGCIREGQTIIWRCAHEHQNRGNDPTGDIAARTCALLVYRALCMPSDFAHKLKRLEHWVETSDEATAADSVSRNLMLWAKAQAEEIKRSN